MKKILSLISICALSFSFVACESLFDNLEGDKSKLSGDYLAQSEAGLSRMMASVYASSIGNDNPFHVLCADLLS